MNRKLLACICALLLLYCGEALGDSDAVSSDILSKIIPVGTPNTFAGEHFTGKNWLYPLTLQQVATFNVTFEPGSYNEWHIHHAEKGGGQILIAISGRGWFQHIALEVPGEGTSTEWLGFLPAEEYAKLK